MKNRKRKEKNKETRTRTQKTRKRRKKKERNEWLLRREKENELSNITTNSKQTHLESNIFLVNVSPSVLHRNT